MAKPFCSRCFTKDPEPVVADIGVHIHWFFITKEDESPVGVGIDIDGAVKQFFQTIPEKDFDYSEAEHGKLLCPDCVVDDMNGPDEGNDSDVL